MGPDLLYTLVGFGTLALAALIVPKRNNNDNKEEFVYYGD